MKYDKSNIMRNAWEIRRTANVSMSIAGRRRRQGLWLES